MADPKLDGLAGQTVAGLADPTGQAPTDPIGQAPTEREVGSASGVQLLPAIDILAGQVVRLKQGDYQQVTVYHADPEQQAAALAAAGAHWLHLVDLDAARGEGADNQPIIARIIAHSGLQVEVGGGVRSLDKLRRLAELGAARIILGTALVNDPNLVTNAVAAYGARICAALDARGGQLAIAGWQQQTELSALELARQLAEQGVQHFLYTDIQRDGLQTGINPQVYRQLAEVTGCRVIVSGGVADRHDLEAVRKLADVVEAVVVGRALYEGSLSVPAALAVLNREELNNE